MTSPHWYGLPTDEHGSAQTYRAGCRCRLCRAAWAGYYASLRLARVKGQGSMVNAQAARAHLLALADCSVGIRQAAKLSGVGLSTVKRIRWGTVDLIRRETSAAILAIPPRPALGIRVQQATARMVETLKGEFPVPELMRLLRLRAWWFTRDHEAVRLGTVLRIRALCRRVHEDGL